MAGSSKARFAGRGRFEGRAANKKPPPPDAVEGSAQDEATWSACAPTKYYENAGHALHGPHFRGRRVPESNGRTVYLTM
ncbi:hypothetical protein Arub01_07590 [Actinomadura rubrobrunea]|uniref:Uncharacterized protein n=1 Tax=Actinomadura rubrobrunea TaxID=115335 RepID=A0A9W6PQ87_9ACTN|nr:hypothetical protein Arub01_07590 [Actinomadura rubrobrunea]